jgi:hypothetical protein
MHGTKRIGLGLFTAGLLTFAFFGSSAAEDLAGLEHTTPAERARFQTGLMTKLLDLEPGQVEKVGALNLAYAKQLDPILKGNQSRLERMMAGRRILEKKDADMKQALPTAQYQRYLDTKKQVREALEAHFASAASGGG